MNTGLGDRNLKQSLTSAERVTGSIPVKQEGNHLLTYSPHKAKTLISSEATAVLNIRQALCFEVQTFQTQRNVFLGQCL